MKTISVAIAEEADLLANCLSLVLANLQYEVILKEKNAIQLLHSMRQCLIQPNICLLNVRNEINIDQIPSLREQYPGIAILGYCNDDYLIDIPNVSKHLDHYICATDTVAQFHKTLLKSYLQYN